MGKSKKLHPAEKEGRKIFRQNKSILMRENSKDALADSVSASISKDTCDFTFKNKLEVKQCEQGVKFQFLKNLDKKKN